jgi:hypothetical protein
VIGPFLPDCGQTFIILAVTNFPDRIWIFSLLESGSVFRVTMKSSLRVSVYARSLKNGSHPVRIRVLMQMPVDKDDRDSPFTSCTLRFPD